MRGLRLIWAALWRAQVAHLAIFVAVPLAAWLAKALLGVVFLPFLLLSFGDTPQRTQASHLSPGPCWVMLMPCALAEVQVLPLSRASAAGPVDQAAGSTATEVAPFLPMPSALTLRHAWFAVWLMWFIAHLWKLERKQRKRRRA